MIAVFPIFDALSVTSKLFFPSMFHSFVADVIARAIFCPVCDPSSGLHSRSTDLNSNVGTLIDKMTSDSHVLHFL